MFLWEDDRSFAVLRAFTAVFILALGLSSYRAVTTTLDARSVTDRDTAAAPVDSYELASIKELWSRDNGVTDVTARPDASLQIANVPDSRCVWHRETSIAESWGFVTESPAREVGANVLEYYMDSEGWDLVLSDVMDMSGNAWGGIVSNQDRMQVVAFVALPSFIGPGAGGEKNPSRVSVLSFDLSKVEVEGGMQ